jgi:hypothetical protein
MTKAVKTIYIHKSRSTYLCNKREPFEGVLLTVGLGLTLQSSQTVIVVPASAKEGERGRQSHTSTSLSHQSAT